MRCPNHLRKEVSGYCSVCAAFMCEECLKEHEGQLYCPKHFKPFQQEAEKQAERARVRQRHSRHKLVVHYLDGRIAKGISMAMNVRDSGFHLECVDNSGATIEQTEKVRFKDVKAVFNVRSFDGKADKNESHPDYTPGGSRVIVVFKDGEEMPGVTLNPYDPDDDRFYLIPEDTSSNNINVLVEATAVEGVYDPQEYEDIKRRKEEEKARQKQQEQAAAIENDVEIGQEESMGDFYFQTHNYKGAVGEYKKALNASPNSPRLKRKVVVSYINVGIQHIKDRDYLKAMECMDRALELEPDNPHALKKAKQLQKVIKKTQRRMEEYNRQKQRAQGGIDDFDL